MLAPLALVSTQGVGVRLPISYMRRLSLREAGRLAQGPQGSQNLRLNWNPGLCVHFAPHPGPVSDPEDGFASPQLPPDPSVIVLSYPPSPWGQVIMDDLVRGADEVGARQECVQSWASRARVAVQKGRGVGRPSRTPRSGCGDKAGLWE